MATVGDGADEPDGSATATLATGSGYSVSSSNGAATVAVADDDPPPDPVPPGDAISSDAEAIELATAERARYWPLRSGPRAGLYWVMWIRAGTIIDALNGHNNRANDTDNGWYWFHHTIANAAAAVDATAVDALTRLGDYFIERHSLRIYPAGLSAQGA